MQNDKKQNILILTCSTGEGHNSAAKALESVLAVKGVCCVIKDVLSFKSEKASGRASALYSAVIKKTPKLFGLAFTIGKIYDGLKLPSPVYSANAKYADRLYAYIIGNGFDCVICTHLFAMQAMTAVRRKFNLQAACYGVMTDYTIYPFVKDSDLDGYFVPDEKVAAQFAQKGFSRDKIFITGIPVHPKFNELISKREAREKLNLPPDKKTVVITTGGAGCGKIIKLCRKLDSSFDGGHTFVVLTGRNDKLKAKLEEVFAENSKFKAVAFTEEVHIYFKAADCVLSKSGGLSSTEIAVSNVPLVHLKAIPGLETANLNYFSENGLSLRADSVGKAVKRTKQLLSDNLSAEAMLKIQKFYIKADAAERIIAKITEDTGSERIFMGAFYSGRLPYGEYYVLQNYSRDFAT